jgi:hypothetical protein
MFAGMIVKLYPELGLRRFTLMVVTQFNAVNDNRAFALGTPGLRPHRSAS